MNNKSKVTIKVKGGNIGRALKQFKRLVNESEHLKELKDRRRYLKPSVKKRMLRNQANRERGWELEAKRKEGLHH